MRMFGTLKHHDHAYVDRRGGLELLTHLRGAPARVEYRRQAIERAHARFEGAGSSGRPEPECCGLGLLVLQRSVLAAEDLGGMLHAFAGPRPWERLRAAGIDEIDGALFRAAREPEAVLREAFRLASDEDMANEGLSAEQIAALSRLRGRVVIRWHRMLVAATELWINHRHAAKATLHGFPFVAGELLLGPPAAGRLAVGVQPPPSGRFAVAVTSRVRGREVVTERTIVRLDRQAVDGYRRSGQRVARLYGELCDHQASSTMSGHAVGIPLMLLPRLAERDQQLINAALESGPE